MQALQSGAWDEARTHFQESLAAGETPQALEQLGLAAWWLDDAALTFDARERAYRLYRDQGDAKGAARVAIWLVWDHLAFHGDTAVASGWLERARRLLEGHEQTAEYGWLLLRDGELALFQGHDTAVARERGERAAVLGRATGDRGLEVTGLALEGLAHVSAGEVAAGLRRLDEATAAATGGEVKELHTVGVVCCWEIFACERVRDYDRAAQWCAREFTRRWCVRVLSAICRVQYAGVLIWRGEWAEAETELAAATKDFEQIRPPLAGQALARLGDLRLRQGRLDEAAQLFERAGAQPIARIGLAALALERDAPEESAAQLERFLAHVGDSEPRRRLPPMPSYCTTRATSRRRRAASSRPPVSTRRPAHRTKQHEIGSSSPPCSPRRASVPSLSVRREGRWRRSGRWAPRATPPAPRPGSLNGARAGRRGATGSSRAARSRSCGWSPRD